VQPPTQISWAAATQKMSHGPWQQDGSSVQIALQQATSLHAPVEWVAKQLPRFGEPQVPGVPPQRNDAAPAQFASQRVEQQKGSPAQTAVQQLAESQPGLACVEVHGPLAVAPQ
jgi:hypothetical protein